MAKKNAGVYKRLKNALKADKVTHFVHRTVPHDNWEPWGKKDIEEMLFDSKVSMSVSYEFVQDVMNIYSHLDNFGAKEDAIVSVSSLKNQVMDYVYKNDLDVEKAKALFKSTLRNYDFLDKMDFDAIDGIGVSERTTNFLLFMQTFLQKANSGSGGNSAQLGKPGTQSMRKEMVQIVSEEDAAKKGTPTPIEQQQQIMNPEIEGTFDENGDPTKPFEEEMNEDMMMTKKLIFDGGISSEVILKNKQRKFTDVYANLSKQNKAILDSLALLGKKSKIKYETKAHYEDDVMSKIKRPMLMRSYDEVSKASLIQHAMPTFNYKLATKALTVHKNVTKHKERQCLIMMIDYSGSMADTKKQTFVKALLLNRMEAVCKGYAELYVCGFVSSRYKLHKISTREDCIKFYEEYNDRPGGGTTDIAGVLARTVKELKENELINDAANGHPRETIKLDHLHHPEIVIINDGQDHIDPSFKTNWKTHAFLLGESNKDLKCVVEKSGGHYEQLF